MFENNYTIGVEEEYMICNPDDGELINKADEIISKIPDNLKDRFSYELLLSEIESNTVICDSVKDACSNILFNRNKRSFCFITITIWSVIIAIFVYSIRIMLYRVIERIV